MTKPRSAPAATPGSFDLEPVVDAVELRLATLAQALRERDTEAVELQASELHGALANAVQCFMHVAQHGGVPDAMRRRLARASAAVARQRESLSRATAALDRAIDVLMPMPHGAAAAAAANAATAIYGATGTSVKRASGAILRA